MPEQSRLGARQDGHNLGASFEQSNSPSFSGDLGPSFEEHNRGAKDNPRRKWYWIGGILILVVLILLVHQFSGDTTGTKPAAPAAGGSGRGRGQQGPAAITTGQSKTGNMPVYVQALGTVTPTYTVTLFSQITGQVLAVHYTEGQLVKKGQALVDIDPRPSQATLDQAVATLKHDQSVLDEAQMDLKRYQDANTAIARQQLEDQEKLVTQEEATTQVDEANIAFDKVQLSYCHIVSPIAGRVGLRLVDPGNTVFSGSSSTLVVVTALQPITVVFNVSEDDLPSVQAQLKTQKTLPVDAFDRADDKMIETGKLTSLDNQIDTTTGTLKFRATYANKGLDLFPNQFVNSRLLLTTLQNATLVPNAAVQHNGTAAFVYIVNADNTVSVQNVTVSTSDDQYTAVTGLNPGVTLATSGFDRLEQGAKVRPQVAGQKGAHGASGTTTTPDGSPSTASGKGKGGHGSGASAQ
jgi:multidrug efflux system membrane fusion protein